MMRKLKQKYLIKASAEKVWQALTNADDICSWGACPAKMNDKKGTNFELWGGDIHGENIEVVPFKRLVQNWKEKDWKDFSKVTFLLDSKNGKTEVELIHENIPDPEYKDIEQGWRDYYLGPLKDLVEKGL